MYENYQITEEAADKLIAFILPLAREYFKTPIIGRSMRRGT